MKQLMNLRELHKEAVWRIPLLRAAALALLASLLPLTGIWPAWWGGVWRWWSAFAFSLGPSIALVFLFAEIRPARNKAKLAEQSSVI